MSKEIQINFTLKYKFYISSMTLSYFHKLILKNNEFYKSS